MKTVISRFLFMCALTGLCTTAFGQAITITAADVTEQLAVGNTIKNIGDTLTVAANIGTLPGPNTWDFSGLFTHITTTLVSVAKPTPFDTAFPGATHALKTSLAGSISGLPGPVRGDLYLFVTVGNNLLNPGNMGSGTISIAIFPGSPPSDFPGMIKIANTPPDTTYGLPSTLGTSWGSTYTTTTGITVSGIPFGTSTSNRNFFYVVDAYGKMKMPGGGEYDALRIKKEDRGGGKPFGYIFLAKNGASVQMTAAGVEQPTAGIIAVSPKSITWSPAFEKPVAVPIGVAIPEEFALRQNYPNPFNPATTIEFQLKSAVRASVRVFDLLGREMATLVDEQLGAGIHARTFDASRLGSGVYVYRLTAGTYVESKKMVLVK